LRETDVAAAPLPCSAQYRVTDDLNLGLSPGRRLPGTAGDALSEAPGGVDVSDCRASASVMYDVCIRAGDSEFGPAAREEVVHRAGRGANSSLSLERSIH
jgi:hypothetical protein